MRLITFNLINKLLVLSLITNFCNALYEDQVGSFDWRRKFVGKVKFAFFDAPNAERTIVATEENVLAAISSKNGDILWRKVFETENSRGEIKFLHVTRDSRNEVSVDQDPYDIITVSGFNPIQFRGWDVNTGNLAWEWSIIPTSADKTEDSQYFVKDSSIYHVLPVWNSHIELTEYHVSTGQQSKAITSKITAGWLTKERCVLSAQYFACVVKDQLLVLDLLANSNNVQTKSLENPSITIAALRGREGFIQVGKQVFSLKDLQVVFENRMDDEVYMDNSLMQMSRERMDLKITSENQELTEVTDIPETLDNNLKIIAVKCKPKRDSTSQLACRFLLSTDDGALALVQQGKIKWIREESLTKIAAVEFLELSLSDAQGIIEEELNSGDADILSSMYRRMHSQYGVVKNIVLHVLGLGPPPSFSQRAGLVRDDFGLHKMMVIITQSGKLFGIDNESGKQHWVKVLKDFTGFTGDQHIKLFVQRTSKFYPLPAQCAIVARDRTTGNGLLYQFNPLSGQSIDGRVVKLDFKIQQASLLHAFNGDNFLRDILFVDDKNEVHVRPETSVKHIDGLFLYIVNKQTGILTGYVLEYNKSSNKASLLPIWSLNLGGTDNEQKITQVASKNPIERVHSQGRVLADRSVLYKYINPNLIAVVTEGPDSIHKYILNVYLIDAVSGAIVFSMNHRRAKGPIKILHSENWLVYTYYNEKIRRNELTTIELYEGKTQTNSTHWSSLNSPPVPLVERQTFIISSNIAALRETITEKGITNKHVLMGMHSGAVVEMPWALLDPRRHSMVAPEKLREEGIIPYIPELGIQHENIINYNQSIAKISGIYTAPSALESTCLTLVYGLDLFVTRVSPSKTFDLLKEDFDYFLISIVLIGLIAASYIVKHLAAKKTIKQAWK